MYKLLVVFKTFHGGVTSQVIEFEYKVSADSANAKLLKSHWSGLEVAVTKLYD